MDVPVHLNRVLTNMVLLAKLPSRCSSALDIRNDRLKVHQELLDLAPLRLHCLRQLRILRMCLVEFGVQCRLRFLQIWCQMSLVQFPSAEGMWWPNEKSTMRSSTNHQVQVFNRQD